MNKEISQFIDRDNFILGIISQRRSGKTEGTKNIIKSLVKDKKIDYVFVFSPTAKHSKNGSIDCVDKKFIFSEYKDEYIKKIKSIQKKRIKENKKSKCLIIFDDMISDKKMLNSKYFKLMVTNSAHYNLSIILITQAMKELLNPVLRANIDYLLIGKMISREEVEKFEKIYLNDDYGKEIMEDHKNQPKYTFIWVDTSETPDNKYNYMRFEIVAPFFLNIKNNK